MANTAASIMKENGKYSEKKNAKAMNDTTISKKMNRSFGGNMAVFIFLLTLGILMMIPFVYAILQSFKPIDEIFIFPPRFWINRPTTENYSMLFSLTSNLWVPFSRYLFNSVFKAIVNTFLQVVVASMAAYPLAKHNFPGKMFFFGLIQMALLFTGDVTGTPQYIIIASLRMINTYWSLIIPALASTFLLYLMRQNMTTIEDSLLEAARIDGANEWSIFWKIIMPIMKPVWLTMVVFSFSGNWNSGEGPYIYNESLKGINTVLGSIASGGIARAGVGAAIGVILIIPPILTFIVTQSNIMEAMSNSGMKD